MKLVCQRRQQASKGLLGGDKGTEFILTCRLFLTPDEEEKVRLYWPSDTLLGNQDESIALGAMFRTKNTDIRLNDLLQGVGCQAKSVGMVRDAEDSLENVCRKFKNYLEVASAFTGERVAEF